MMKRKPEHRESGCIERDVWNRIETGPLLCKDCPAGYGDAHFVCHATKKKNFVVDNEGKIVKEG